jgi:hypothetical protein
MTTAEKIAQLEKEVHELKVLFSALVPLDNEGEYKERFLRDMATLADQKPAGKFEGKGSLVKLVS